MKNKKNKLLFASFFIFIIVFSFYFSIVDIAHSVDDIYFTPEIGIPGFYKSFKVDGGLMGTFGNVLYSYLLSLSGIVAVIILILAGFQWVTAGGNQNKIGQAKERIKNAITGLILLACSHLILYTVNPELVRIKVLDVDPLSGENIESIKPVNNGLDPTYYNERYAADPHHESEGQQPPIAVLTCLENNPDKTCIPWEQYNNNSEEWDCEIGKCDNDTDMCCGKRSPCSSRFNCSIRANCGEIAFGYCDGGGSKICCKKQKSGLNIKCSHNINCQSNCCCDNKGFLVSKTCRTANYCNKNENGCVN
ncbi:MAG: pilin [Patescibacteria group bacterium]|nr:pilin [Patescibacteria group bacterium]